MQPKVLLDFQSFILGWHARYGRHELPWRQNYHPYQVLVSETMLQQTQVERVVPKFQAFIKEFPTIKSLAAASAPEVIKLWQGLGYNRRALNLHRAAQAVVADFAGDIPKNETHLLQLPGVGPYTASAIQAFAFNQPVVVIETNIRTVFNYHFFPEADLKSVTDSDLIPLIAASLPKHDPRTWYAALMDYGSYLKKILPNPSRKSKHYAKQSQFKGSKRQVRGAVIRFLTHHHRATSQDLSTIEGDLSYLEAVLQDLQTESFIIKEGKHYQLKP